MNFIENLFKRPTKTREGLPLLTEETRLAFTRELERDVEIRTCPTNILSKWATETWKENPEIMRYLRELIQEYPREMYGPTLAGFLSLYRILKSQALNDKIREYFSKPID